MIGDRNRADAAPEAAGLNGHGDGAGEGANPATARIVAQMPTARSTMRARRRLLPPVRFEFWPYPTPPHPVPSLRPSRASPTHAPNRAQNFSPIPLKHMQNTPSKNLLRAAQAVLAALLVAAPASAATIFETTFASDTLNAATNSISPTAANWYVMSSKDARGSSVNGTGGLTITHTSSTSGVVEATARLASLPIDLRDTGDYIEATGTFYTDKVLNLVFGLYNSGGVDPLVTAPNGTTLLANTGLVATAGATGGTLGWKGYRAMVANSYSGTAPNQTIVGSTAGSIQARPAQTGTPTYQAYDLVSAGTGGFNSPAAISIGTVAASTTSVAWANSFGAEYRFIYRIQRSSATAFVITYTITDPNGATLFSTSGTTTSATALPSAITTAFDSFAIGLRNSSANAVASVPSLSVTQLKLSGANADLVRITAQPANQSLTPGQSANLSVTAAGTGTLSYQWSKDGSPISGATNATYPIASASVADTGSYTVKVSNAYGYETSASATVSINSAAAPVFTAQPSSQSVDAGTTLTLTAAASGAPTPTYQWFKDNVAISGATSATYTVASATTASAGSYKVVATNSQGAATSNTVTVTVVTAAPVITAQPAPVTINVADPIALSVTATGIPVPTYQWYKDSVAITGATASSYTVSSATTADAGSYTVVVSNGIGSPATSDAALVTVNVVAPTVSAPPVSATVVYGNSATLIASYTGSQPRTYQWYKDGNAISGATSSSYTIASATLAEAGAYHVVVTNSAGSATSTAAAITVVFASESTAFATDFSTSTLHNAAAPITSASTSWWVLASRAATTSALGDDPATAEVVETRPLTLKFTTTTGSSIVEGAARFTSTPLSLATPGNYLRLTANLNGKNLRILAFGFYNSGGANPFPLWGNPAADIIGTGGTNTAAVGLGTQGWIGYRASIQATSSAADIGTRPAQTLATTNRGNELLMPPGSTGAAHGDPAGVAIGTVPGFPASVVLADNTNYTLVYTITRSGSDQYTIDYKIYNGTAATGVPLYSTGGTTTAAAALPSAMTSSFDAVAIGFRNMDTTSIPELTVANLKIDYATAVTPAAPLFTAQPSSQTLAPGAALTLSAAATGAPAPSYQWYKNDVAISGATSATYTIASVASGDAGSYKVVATNPVGSATSNTAAITVGAAASPYASWASAQGLSAGVNDGATQDPDNDGVANLVEFALGGNPLSAASAPAPTVARSGSNLTFTYDVKTAAAAQFAVTAETSSDLSAWTAAVHGSGGVTIATTDVDAATNRVVVTIPASGARVFARLRVQTQP